MRLSTIKLSGFKSFVDATVLHLPGNLTAVVGPNGCGKSNIIDAVRWVMGESSASRLRGDSLADVIFSGSASRKPVSQAMVELVFDNSDGLVGGEFARFSEIAVKRTVSRDGLSVYYLNGSKCRRRDITDLFLGTGLGPRSYSIIEQGMISQIIEARPEELRVYLEEAAGISRYKERRRETETRIRHTRENLERLGDLREEVDKQLAHLKRQARAAEVYTGLQGEQRTRAAQLKALHYRGLDAELATLRETLLQDQTRLEELVAEQRHAEARIEAGRAQHEEARETLNQAQARVYQASAEIARIEQQVQHQRELRQRLESGRGEASAALDELAEHIANDERQLAELREAIQVDQPRLDALRGDEDERHQTLRDAESALADWQPGWDEHTRAQADAGRAAEIERTRIEYLERQSLEARRRSDTLRGEWSGLDVAALEDALDGMQREHDSRKAGLDALAEALDARKGEVAAVQEQQRAGQTELAELRKQLQTARGRLASLEALQHAALGQENDAAGEWLRREDLAHAPRLGELLEVEAGWETAVETVLGTMLEAVAVDAPESRFEALAALEAGRLALIDADAGGTTVPADSLASRVAGPAAIRRWLVPVKCVADHAEARARLATLADGESVVTRAGEWAGRGWLRALRSGEAQQGALAREREIQSLRAEIERFARGEAGLVDAQSQLRSRVQELDQQREDAQRALYLEHRGVSELAGQLEGQRGRLQTSQERRGRIDEELAQLEKTLEESRQGASEARARLERSLGVMADLESRREGLESDRRKLGLQRDAAAAAAREARDATHQLALVLESRHSQATALTQSIARMAGQRSQVQQRLDEFASQLGHGDEPVQSLEAQRRECLDQRVEAEQALAAARNVVDGIEAELRGHEQVRQQRDQQALAQREAIGKHRLEEQALALRAQQLADGITVVGLTVDGVLAELPGDADPDTWQQALDTIEARMKRLEPVNLAAIQEYGEAAQRKSYLDAQNEDLCAALETLEQAIRKIDRDTRGRFKDTFDRVNSGMQELYPRLFGGGHAYLELTGDDLLDAGVAIMARPPGKRVSNISLLSGGEKALTAVALVFAIFRLNPAPFCLLDEVDAPLDEANVGRFCAMVSEMSTKVQFLIVTHNKATMEAARQLSGVTMREPGVSRLVSVDLDEAARMAGAA